MRHFSIATTFVIAFISAVALTPDLGRAQNPSQVPMPPRRLQAAAVGSDQTLQAARGNATDGQQRSELRCVS